MTELAKKLDDAQLIDLPQAIPTTDFGIALELEKIKSGPSYADLLAQIVAMELEAPRIVVRNVEDRARAVDCLAQLALVEKRGEELRKRIVALPKKFTSKVDELFRSLREDVARVRTPINQKILAFDKEQELARRKEQERLEKETARLQKKLDRAGVDMKLEAPVAAPVEKVSHGQVGTGFTVKTWAFEVTDKLALVRAVAEGRERAEALDVNPAYINGLIKAGVREIPGIRIYQKEDLRVRTR